MENSSYDVVIVGAGLAGLAAAETIACGSDASVVVIERHDVGSNKPVPATFVDVIERFGLGDHVQGRYRRFTFHSPLGNYASHVYDRCPLVALDYQTACEELLDRSQIAGDVTLVQGQASRLRRAVSGQWQVHTSTMGAISTSLLIDASGRGLFATRALGLPRPRLFSHCFGQTLVGGSVPNRREMFFLAPSDRFGDGGGWLYPLSDGLVSFGFATLGNEKDYPEEAVRESYDRALREFTPYADWLADAKPVRDDVGTIPICPPRRFVYEGLMLVGDAAGQATIWSCMGIEAALVSGQAAGKAAVVALQRDDYSTKTLARYQHQWDRDHGRIYRQGALLAPSIWGQREVDWNHQVALTQELTPEQMLARLRTNGSLLPWWKIAFKILYDQAGRARRASAGRLRDIITRLD